MNCVYCNKTVILSSHYPYCTEICQEADVDLALFKDAKIELNRQRIMAPGLVKEIKRQLSDAEGRLQRIKSTGLGLITTSQYFQARADVLKDLLAFMERG